MKKLLLPILAMIGATHASDKPLNRENFSEVLSKLKDIKSSDYLEISKSDIIKLLNEIHKLEDESGPSVSLTEKSFDDVLEIIDNSETIIRSGEVSEMRLGTQGYGVKK